MTENVNELGIEFQLAVEKTVGGPGVELAAELVLVSAVAEVGFGLGAELDFVFGLEVEIVAKTMISLQLPDF